MAFHSPCGLCRMSFCLGRTNPGGVVSDIHIDNKKS